MTYFYRGVESKEKHMRITALCLFVVALGSIQAQDLSVTQYYNDSVSLYQKYKNDITYLKSLKPEDTATWTASCRHKHTLTCAQQKELSAYNHVWYAPIDSFKRDGFEGYAYLYPKPTEREHKGYFVNGNITGPQFRFVAYDHQTRFLLKEDGKTRIPYIQKITFDKGRILFIEKLNPITKEKID